MNRSHAIEHLDDTPNVAVLILMLHCPSSCSSPSAHLVPRFPAASTVLSVSLPPAT